GGSVGLEEQFGGSGRAMITASSALEYAFEGASVADTSDSEPSVFTSALVEGLESGDADRDQDGHVGLDELYDYVYDRVRRVTPHQTPSKWMLDVRGDLRIARRARPVSVPAALPSDLQEAIDHSLPGVRAGAIPSLVRMLSVAHEGRVLAARLALRRLADDDSRMVAAAARRALGEEPAPAKAPAQKPPSPKTPAPTSLIPPAPKLSVPPETMGVGTSISPGGDEAGSIPKWEARRLVAVLPRLAAGLALTLLVVGLMTVSGGLLGHLGDTTPNTVLFGTFWPWALVAAMFVLTCRDHPWLPGAALGLVAGMTGLLGGSEGTYLWFLLGMAATIIAIAGQATPLWLAAASAVLGAAGVLVIVSAADEMQSFAGDSTDLTFAAVVTALIGLAVHRIWRERAWLSAIAPGLLLLDAALNLTNAPLFVVHAGLAGLVVVPLIATLTSGTARFAGYVTVAAGLLVRTNEYVSANEPTFTTIAHVALPLAAAIVAYFSRSR
ncbi:MAG: hypothetical protein HOV94_29760, partial [Saccharothrix sp.]|nr:hypothetical protein [Saccharothrix sp.]